MWKASLWRSVAFYQRIDAEVIWIMPITGIEYATPGQYLFMDLPSLYRQINPDSADIRQPLFIFHSRSVHARMLVLVTLPRIAART